MNYSPHKLPEEFEYGEPLVPANWIAFLWADDENDAQQVHPSSLPGEGDIVALLTDKRLIPGDAYLVKMTNGLEMQKPTTENFVDNWFHKVMTKKRYIRRVLLARYAGLDEFGCPRFTNVGYGSNDATDFFKFNDFPDTYVVAWRPIDIPYLPDVEI